MAVLGNFQTVFYTPDAASTACLIPFKIIVRNKIVLSLVNNISYLNEI